MAHEASTRLNFAIECHSKRLLQLRDWWHSIAREGRLPSKSDFQLSDWKKHLPWIAAVDPIRSSNGETADYCFKVFGSYLVQPFGAELTGKTLSEIGEPFVTRWVEPIRLVDRKREPVVAAGSILIPERNFQEFEILVAPLFGADGTVDRYLAEVELRRTS